MKDTLGDSGMLLDTEITMTNSPDSSPTQVHNVLNKVIMRKMGEHKRNMLRIHQQIEQRNRFASSKLTNFVNSHSKNCTVPLNYKIHHLKVKGTAMQSQLNPYADENDIDNNFQLSKTINATVNPRVNTSVMTDMLNGPRFFGKDCSNLLRSQNIINLRRENFHTFNISNNMIVKNSSTNLSEIHTHNQNPQLTDENTVMFRNYDLNDDYWFNFE